MNDHEHFVEKCIKPAIKDRRVMEAFLRVPRHKFVPPEYRDAAYIDAPLPIGEGQTISQPSTVARMLLLAELQERDDVLEIGTGSGWNTAGPALP